MKSSRYSLLVVLAGVSLLYAEGVSLEWGTYFGGSSGDRPGDVVARPSGNVLFTGGTFSSGFAHNCQYSNRSGSGDGFWAEFSPEGDRLSTCHLIGKGSSEDITSVAFDAENNMYLSGSTSSADGIATEGAHQTTYAVGKTGTYYSGKLSDSYFAKINAQGDKEWGTYFGGRDGDGTTGAVVGLDGDVYFAGVTSSLKHISTTGAHQEAMDPASNDTESKNIYSDGYLTRFTPEGEQVWGTYLGGAANDEIYGLAADSHGNLYVAGWAASHEGIATDDAYQVNHDGFGSDAFLAKFDAEGNRIWGTYLGGGDRDRAYAVAVDDEDNVYMCGSTASSDLAPDVAINNFAGIRDGFIAKFTSEGTCVWVRYYGGAEFESTRGIACADGKVYITGYTRSGSGIALDGFDMEWDAEPGGRFDVFVAAFAADDGRQIWGTYYGGSESDKGWTLDVGEDGRIYVAGETRSTNGIAKDAFLDTHQGGDDTFLACLVDNTSEVFAAPIRHSAKENSPIGVRVMRGRTVGIMGTGNPMPVSMELLDMAGRSLMKTHFMLSGATMTTLSLPVETAGIYLVLLKSANATFEYRCILR